MGGGGANKNMDPIWDQNCFTSLARRGKKTFTHLAELIIGHDISLFEFFDQSDVAVMPVRVFTRMVSDNS